MLVCPIIVVIFFGGEELVLLEAFMLKHYAG